MMFTAAFFCPVRFPQELSNATGNILDNQELISTLEEAKAKAVELAEKLEVSKVTAVEIDETRVKYTPVAKRGSILYFAMASLSAITNMYEYSLASFLSVFNGTLGTSKKDSMLEGRLRNVIDALTFDVYNYTCLGLFEKHKLMFSLQMTTKILEGDSPLDPQVRCGSNPRRNSSCPPLWWPLATSATHSNYTMRELHAHA